MVEGVNASMICSILCENLCKCHNVPPPSTQWQNKIRKNYEHMGH
jgi:hypothetical protein